ncbi:MAG: methylenetetrahydrofolate reductase C-terminal domain-containing protein [Dehalococcoidia bacterium]
MIIVEQKPLEEMHRMIAPFEKVMILGCGTCVTVCNAGGEREVAFLHEALQFADARNGDREHVFVEHTLKRQCDEEFLDLVSGEIADIDAILSLGCGIGVQSIAGRFPNTVVLPGVNTSFLGMAREFGVWDERCAACGDCRLEETAGICPITRCTKGILNGPCAGTKNGKCEVNPEMDCGWALIYRRLEGLGQLDKMRRYYPPRNWRPIPRPRRIVAHQNAVPAGGEKNG